MFTHSYTYKRLFIKSSPLAQLLIQTVSSFAVELKAVECGQVRIPRICPSMSVALFYGICQVFGVCDLFCYSRTYPGDRSETSHCLGSCLLGRKKRKKEGREEGRKGGNRLFQLIKVKI